MDFCLRPLSSGIYWLSDDWMGKLNYSFCIQQIMSEARKNQILEEFRRPSGNKSSKSRDLKARLYQFRSKETFLTDTQTSDYTKSSGQINAPRIQHLEEIIRKLQRENAELRQKVIDLKTSQCFEINEDKLKNVIRQNDQLRNQLERTKKQLEQSLVERDFLERFNKNLKTQCETLTKEILTIKSLGLGGESKRTEKSIYTSRDEGQNSKSRNSSNSVSKSSKKRQFMNWRKEKDEKEKDREKEASSTLKNSISASGLHEDYYGGRTNRQRQFKHQ